MESPHRFDDNTSFQQLQEEVKELRAELARLKQPGPDSPPDELAAISLRLNQALTESTLVNSITTAVAGEYDLHKMLDLAFKQLGQVINFTGGSIALVEGDTLVIRAAIGPFAEQALGQQLKRKQGQGRSWQVVETGEPFFSNNLSAANVNSLSPVESFMAIPLNWQGQAFGLLEIDSKYPGAFKPQDLDLLQKVGQALSGSIQLAIRYAAEKEALNEAQEARGRLAFLSEASALLASSLDYAATLQQVVDLAVPRLADWCAIDLPGENEEFIQVALAPQDSEKVKLAEELRKRYPPSSNALSGLMKVFRSGQPACAFEITDEMLVAAARDAEHLELMRKFELRSTILVPLIARGRTMGVVTLANTRPDRRYDNADLEMAVELARRAALALDNALLYQEAHQAIQTRDEFLSIAAHELKTPVTSLRGYTQLVLRQFRKAPELDPNQAMLLRKLEIIEEQSQKLGKLLGRLLDISRLEADKLRLERQPTDLVGMIEQVIETLQTGTIRPNLKLEVVVKAGGNRAITAAIDPLRIEQVLINLLDNAIKFSPEGGVITVEIRLPQAKKVEVAITDQGVGIPVEQRARLFDRFYQAHTTGHMGGMGLGLFISRQIIELHRGQLEAEFPPEGGTRFVITLPVE